MSLPEVSAGIEALGFHGNIGQRSKFTWKGESYYLLEAEGCHDCWDSWRIVLCDKNMSPITILPLRGVKDLNDGKGHTTAFANPFIG